MTKVKQQASINVLDECKELQQKKADDYQADASTIKQADYYPNGVSTIIELLWQKMMRLRSVSEKARMGQDTNFESLEDSFKDMINYASFGVAYIRGEMPGQLPNRDMFNREVK